MSEKPPVSFRMRTTGQDLRYAARLLRKHRGFTLTAVAVLTLGIGRQPGIFGILNGLMIRPSRTVLANAARAISPQTARSAVLR
ncbi:MAG TPA: hypothetical protein VNG89_15955 [Vicinamibacterales bacterium]|nr:hypothetical protein [Vicinamibacterales bacterium]